MQCIDLSKERCRIARLAYASSQFNVQEFKVTFHLAALKPTLSRKPKSPFQPFQTFHRFALFKSFKKLRLGRDFEDATPLNRSL